MKLDEVVERVRVELTFVGNCEVVPDDYGFSVWVDITLMAQCIFGDIITIAKQKVDWFAYDEEFYDADDQINMAVRGTREFIESELQGDVINADQTEVQITFTNGVTINIDWSEWGSIARKEV
jgi:hypothetical protein